MPDGLQQIGKMLLVLGAVVFAIGLILIFSGKIPWLGRLPGDILIKKKDFTFYFPVATSIIISIILTLLFWLFGRR